MKYFPTVSEWQNFCPTKDVVPLGQLVHADWPSPLYVPPLHALQDGAGVPVPSPALIRRVPAPHG